MEVTCTISFRQQYTWVGSTTHLRRASEGGTQFFDEGVANSVMDPAWVDVSTYPSQSQFQVVVVHAIHWAIPVIQTASVADAKLMTDLVKQCQCDIGDEIASHVTRSEIDRDAVLAMRTDKTSTTTRALQLRIGDDDDVALPHRLPHLVNQISIRIRGKQTQEMSHALIQNAPDNAQGKTDLGHIEALEPADHHHTLHQLTDERFGKELKRLDIQWRL